MLLTFNKLSKHLEKQGFKVYIHVKKDVVLHASVLISSNLNAVTNNVVYIGTASSFPRTIVNSQDGCYILIADSDTPSKNNQPYSQCNYVLLPADTDLMQLYNVIQEFFINGSIMSSFSATLLSSIINGKCLQDIINTAYEFLENPITLVDNYWKLLAYTKNITLDDKYWLELSNKGYYSSETVLLITKRKLLQKLINTDQPIIHTSGDTENYRKMTGKIMISQRIFGYISVWEYNRLFTEQDKHLLQLTCGAIGEVMQKNDYYRYSKGEAYEYLLKDLLDIKIEHVELINDRINSIKWNFGDTPHVLVLDNSFPHTSTSFTYNVRIHLERLIPLSKSVFYQDHLIFFFDKSANTNVQQERIEQIKKLLHKNRLKAGVSSKISNILDLSLYYTQAITALDLGKRLNLEEDLYFYDNLLIYHLLSNCNTLEPFCHQGILALEDYDKHKDTRYFETLLEYLKNDKSVSKTAAALHIHPNTMSYRLKKITKIANIDLDNLEQCAHILFSFKMLDLLKTHRD